MSAGRVLDEELTRILGAAGRFTLMMVRRRISRHTLDSIAYDLEQSARAIRRVVDTEASPRRDEQPSGE